eukprot:Phypoly_transcript_25829.p1 GENE.Phypoly_transcript_25829~~Phypoly_transcript_25829.p1  ORF type:complete len:145 (+),score=18.66 Phypoly_transcript_25829:53-487(+)
MDTSVVLPQKGKREGFRADYNPIFHGKMTVTEFYQSMKEINETFVKNLQSWTALIPFLFCITFAFLSGFLWELIPDIPIYIIIILFVLCLACLVLTLYLWIAQKSRLKEEMDRVIAAQNRKYQGVTWHFQTRQEGKAEINLIKN